MELKEKLSGRNVKGITLIALVITIIVLLILAGVAISMLSGENGILTKAGTAKTDTQKASAIEQARIKRIITWAVNKNNETAKISENILKEKEWKKEMAVERSHKLI